MADVMLSTAAELATCSKLSRGAQDLYVDPGVEAEINATWQQKEDVKTCLRPEPNNGDLRKVVKKAIKILRIIHKVVVLSFFRAGVRNLETRFREGDRATFSSI